ncbi:hypothetical protein BH23GEM9_BH23GEM9_21050 [soil metagenome]
MHHHEEERFRSIFRSAHADHAGCADDEWLERACSRPDDRNGVTRPLVWSRRNGPWRRVELLWVGAAPGNAGGLGTGSLGAHGTRIPFGGDIAGGNLDTLLSSIGVSRNETFLTASLNLLPEKGGGEPSAREIAAPAGAYPDSVALLRDTIIAAGPTLVVALGNVALRVITAAVTRQDSAAVGQPHADVPPPRLPGMARLAEAGFRRGMLSSWPDTSFPPDSGFLRAWTGAWGVAPTPRVLPLLHPSAQNMSPFAGTHTLFHQRMLETRDALRQAASDVFGWTPPEPRPRPPDDGIYALREWRDRVGPAHRRYDDLWREKGV